MNKKLLKLEFDLDFVLIAITSAQKDYRICYLINKYLHFNFIRTDDLEVNIHPDKEVARFSMYQRYWEASETYFFLIANRGAEGMLIPEMREADYFLMIRYYIDEQDLNDMMTGLNKIPEIVVAIKIDPKKIKSRENLLF